MTLKLYAHPLSSYCQKAEMALYENGTPFELKMLDGSEPVWGDSPNCGRSASSRS